MQVLEEEVWALRCFFLLKIWTIHTVRPRIGKFQRTNIFHIVNADFHYFQYEKFKALKPFKKPQFSFCFRWILVTLGSSIAGFNCSYHILPNKRLPVYSWPPGIKKKMAVLISQLFIWISKCPWRLLEMKQYQKRKKNILVKHHC